ncbi:hypothetical protein FRACYDRAFT_257289 [Fragilariopsis cylindrus CCMP1102]|uniref:Uncharacterized protein n=1 Tax=Fragilariopsis cylindrus CCMP1102 TaxID=635003 RepID=A0A1E7EJ93_9STRA|nr:hypothetical protein FRACYDRAFT_257289 [Fragilariopsis cylindrus CCMP1102]|eukprot:OEU05922.1 hypothetical protein FRACYDRAFT_257289 [Fragilariopsis cylindrus CCMP1102]
MTILPNIISSSGFTSGDTVISSLCELRKRPLLSSIPAFSVLQDRIQNVVTLFLPKTWSRIMEFEEMKALIVIRAVHSILKKRSPTLSRAKTTIESRIQHHRAYRTRRYDVYLPSSLFSTTTTTSTTSTLATTTNNKLQVLLFLPGAYVSHEAYSEIASRLSDEGFVVAVLSMEPLRLADSRLGNTDVTTMKEIMNSITNEILPSTSKSKLKSKPLANMGNADNNISNNNNKKIIEFTLMGHSLGAFAAMKLFRELVVDNVDDTNDTNDTNKKNEDKAKHNQQQQQQQQQKESSMTVIAIKKSLSIPEIEIGISNKLIMWGVAAFIPYLTDLSSKSIHHTTNARNKNVIDILIVQGTSDTVIKMMNTTTTKKEEFDSYFPPQQVLHKVLPSNSICASSTTRTEMITGGTHEGFSSYRSSFSGNNKEDKDDNANNVDDDDTLSLSKQHEQVCYITAQFLRS